MKTEESVYEDGSYSSHLDCYSKSMPIAASCSTSTSTASSTCQSPSSCFNTSIQKQQSAAAAAYYYLASTAKQETSEIEQSAMNLSKTSGVSSPQFESISPDLSSKPSLNKNKRLKSNDCKQESADTFSQMCVLNLNKTYLNHLFQMQAPNKCLTNTKPTFTNIVLKRNFCSLKLIINFFLKTGGDSGVVG